MVTKIELSEEIFEIIKMLEKMNKNIVLLIENTNKIIEYTDMRLPNGRNDIKNIRETLKNINEEKEIEENTDIKRIKEILQQLENLLEYEENNRCITKKHLEELLKIREQKPINFNKPLSTWKN